MNNVTLMLFVRDYCFGLDLMFLCKLIISITLLSTGTHCMNEYVEVKLSDISLMFAPSCTHFWKLETNNVSYGLVNQRQPPGAVHPWGL